MVDVFVDPICPWAWGASRWLTAVAPERSLRLRWRSLSLELRDAGLLPSTVPPEQRADVARARRLGHQMLRVFEALRASPGGGEPAVDALYAAWGAAAFAGGPGSRPEPPEPRQVIVAAGLDPDVSEAADDERWDAVILESMNDAFSFAGPKSQTPVVVIRDDPPHGFKGPVMRPPPKGREAVELWDAVATLSAHPGFFELSRPRR